MLVHRISRFGSGTVKQLSESMILKCFLFLGIYSSTFGTRNLMDNTCDLELVLVRLSVYNQLLTVLDMIVLLRHVIARPELDGLRLAILQQQGTFRLMSLFKTSLAFEIL
ncbi:hypothetical protein YC2023_029319 [Brassica napus]